MTATANLSARAWILAAAAVLTAFLVFALLAEAFAPAPQGPPGSSFATTPGGVAGYAQLLQRDGHQVAQLREHLATAAPPRQATLIVLDPPSLSAAAARNLDRFVRAGGRLVIGGGDPATTLPALLGEPPHFSGASSTTFHSVTRLPETAGVTTIRTAGVGAWTAGPGIRALTAGDGALLLVQRRGQGRLNLLADPSPLENHLLASADNAQLALNLAGPTHSRVIFAEALHGYGEATGLAAIPTRWWLAFGGLCLAAAAWALARGRRIGPPEPPPPAPPPPRSAYVDALATVLVRTRDSGTVERALNHARDEA